MDQTLTYIGIASFFIALWTLWGIRPILGAKLDWSKMPARNTSNYPDEFILALSVKNSGVLPIKYTVKNRLEILHSKYPEGHIVESYPLTEPIKSVNAKIVTDTAVGQYNERINDSIVASSNKATIFYNLAFKLAAGESTPDGHHVLGTIGINVEILDYDAALKHIWESYVEIAPLGFWGLPVIRKLNTRRVSFTNVTLTVKAVDRLT